MSLNVSKVHDLVELYAGKAGSDSTERVNPTLLREIINIKLRDFCAKTHCLEGSWTIDSVADQQEYELSDNVLDVRECHFDGYRAYKITHMQVAEFGGTLS
jgi:hypothetical protein